MDERQKRTFVGCMEVWLSQEEEEWRKADRMGGAAQSLDTEEEYKSLKTSFRRCAAFEESGSENGRVERSLAGRYTRRIY